MSGRVSSDQRHAEFLQIVVTCQLNDQIASKPAGILDEHPFAPFS